MKNNLHSRSEISRTILAKSLNWSLLVSDVLEYKGKSHRADHTVGASYQQCISPQISVPQQGATDATDISRVPGPARHLDGVWHTAKHPVGDKVHRDDSSVVFATRHRLAPIAHKPATSPTAHLKAEASTHAIGGGNIRCKCKDMPATNKSW